jgi:hypothetical protein
MLASERKTNKQVEFHEILTQFRSLGGVAENLTLRHGTHGRGLFAVNPGRPVQLHVPEQLLVAPQWVELDEKNHIRIAAKYSSSISTKATAFFEKYQKFYGWGNDCLKSIKKHQLDLQALPPKLKNFLHILGGAEELKQKPTKQYCLQNYFITRQIGIKSGSRLMPIAELINHAPDGLPYVLADGVKVAGVVKDEILTRYHSHLDSFHFFVNYHFVAAAHTALSCEVTVEVPTVGTLHIARMDQLADILDTIRIPKIANIGTQMNLSFVEIANKTNPSQPRKTFAHLMATQHVSFTIADVLFDGIIDHNRQVLKELILACHRHPSEIASCLEKVASFQLAIIG